MISNPESLKEIDLLSFFEVEPSRLDSDIPWPYNQFTYRTQVGQYKIHFCIAPSYIDVDLSVSNGDAEIYRFEGRGVPSVRYHNDDGTETLEIVVSDTSSLWLRIRPSLFITQSVSEK